MVKYVSFRCIFSVTLMWIKCYAVIHLTHVVVCMIPLNINILVCYIATHTQKAADWNTVNQMLFKNIHKWPCDFVHFNQGIVYQFWFSLFSFLTCMFIILTFQREIEKKRVSEYKTLHACYNLLKTIFSLVGPNFSGFDMIVEVS